MIFKRSIKITFILYMILNSIVYSDENRLNRIEVLVNDEVITKYDIVQRMKINSILKRIEIDDNNYNQLLKSVIEDLIVEKLKVKKIEQFNINFDENEMEKYENRFYSNNNYKKEELKNLFLINNINHNYLIEYIEIELKWQKLIYGLYLRVTTVTEQEIFDLISKNPNINQETANELILQKQLDLKSIKLIKDLRDEATIEYK